MMGLGERVGAERIGAGVGDFEESGWGVSGRG